jgi:methionine-rich copper-binding protein CopC
MQKALLLLVVVAFIPRAAAAQGDPLGPEFRVNTVTTSAQALPSVASDSAGNFVVAWAGDNQDGNTFGVFAQRYASTGVPLGGEFQVNSYTSSNQSLPSVASDSAGTFVVAWQSLTQDGSGYGVFGQRYSSTGSPLGGEFRINSYTTAHQRDAAVTSDSAGNFVVVWESYFQDGSHWGVFGQRFSAACEARVEVKGDVHTPGSKLPIRIHIAHNRPETVTVPWEMALIDAQGRVVAKHTTQPHTFEPGDVVDKDVEFRLPDDLASGMYTVSLAISGMAGTKGATTSFQVVTPK